MVTLIISEIFLVIRLKTTNTLIMFKSHKFSTQPNQSLAWQSNGTISTEIVQILSLTIVHELQTSYKYQLHIRCSIYLLSDARLGFECLRQLSFQVSYETEGDERHNRPKTHRTQLLCRFVSRAPTKQRNCLYKNAIGHKSSVELLLNICVNVLFTRKNCAL